MTFGFLFDNDGVLMDTTAFHWRSWQLLLKEESSDFKMSEQTFLEGFGKRNELILKTVAPHLHERHQELADRKEELFRECARGRVELLPGIEDFLKELKRRNIPRIIASSTPVENLEMYLESTPLGDYFDLYISGEDVAHGKPAPDIFLEAAKALSLPPKNCFVIEDAPVGITAGKAAGCQVIALGTTHPKEALDGYDYYYSSGVELNAFLKIFDKLSKSVDGDSTN